MKIFCGWFMDEWNEGAILSANTLHALGERGIHLDIDLYGKEGEPDPEGD